MSDISRKISENFDARYNQNSEQSQMEQTLTPLVKDMIRKKVNSYLSYQVSKSFNISKQTINEKKIKPIFIKEFSHYSNIFELLKEEKAVIHLYKQKIEKNLDECLYFYIKLLTLAIDLECRISGKELDQEASITIDAFIFIASSLQEVGAEKAAYYFAAKGISFCEQYKIFNPIGEFLFLMAKILRKLFKYKESILVLKKALEYTWWKDKTNGEIFQLRFMKWLSENSPDEIDQFVQKYEVSRVINLEKSMIFSRANKMDKTDLQLKTYRDLFGQFLTALKISQNYIFYDIVLKKPKSNDKVQRALDLQIQIYNELSFNFLQLNKKQQSKIFAEKYETGYTEPVQSKIILLSTELIYSIQKRTASWHLMERSTFQLIFFIDIFEEIQKNRNSYKHMDQNSILRAFKINFETFCESFMQKDMFQYEIPMPLQIKRDVIREKKKHEGQRFILKQRSTSVMPKQNLPVIKKFTSDKVEENFIFNYRGIGISRTKLLNICQRFIDKVYQKEKAGFLRMVGWFKRQAST